MGMTPLPPLKPAPPHIAVFGEGDDPEPFQAQLEIAELDTAMARHLARARAATTVAVGVALGALPSVMLPDRIVVFAVAAAILLLCAVVVLWSRTAATNAMLAMGRKRTEIVPPFRVIEREEKD